MFVCVVWMAFGALEPGAVIVPAVAGDWWQVAGDPDLGAYTTENQQPVDFGVWQAADGTWQLWSCIRQTACGGNTRLFHRWEGRSLTAPDWQPMGIAMEAKPELGETPGGLQAPHVVQWNDRYWMAYGDWVNICFAVSSDGKTFERVIRENGKTGVFTEGPGANARDAMLTHFDGQWHCYYTAFPHGKGAVYCRTSDDLQSWSPSFVVCYGGKIGNGPVWAECPHVVEPNPGEFILFRNQFYGENATCWVYHSKNPYNFGIDDDANLVGSLPIAAPEIIFHEGRYYIAALKSNLKGIQIARLEWMVRPKLGKPVFDLNNEEVREQWSVVEGEGVPALTQFESHRLNPPLAWFVRTSAGIDGTRDDQRTCIIESPGFTAKHGTYELAISGGNDMESTYVAVIDSESNEEIARYTGRRTLEFEMETIDTSAVKGRTLRIRIVDRATGEWGHINFGGLFEEPKLKPLE